MGGDNIPDLIKIVSDFDLLTIWCKQICDGNINLELVPGITTNNMNGFVTIRYFMSEDKMIGCVVKEINRGFFHKISNIVEYKFFVDIGDTILSNRDLFSRLGYVIVKGKTYEETNQLADWIVHQSIIKVENNN